MNPLAIPLPVAARRPGDMAGLLIGLSCFPVAFYRASLAGLLPEGPAGVVLPIVLLSGLAGLLGSAITHPDQAPEVGGLPLRVGASAGFIAALVAGAASTLAETLHVLGLGVPSPIYINSFATAALLPTSVTGVVIVLGLLALPPSIFFGLIGALIAGALKSRSALLVVQDGEGNVTVRRRGAVFVSAVTLSLACYLSPLLVFLKPARVTISPTAASPPISVPAPPPFTYDIPVGFDRAAVAERTIISRQGLGRVAEGPIALSQDGRWLAFVRADYPTQVTIRNLHDASERRQSLPSKPMQLGWSPGSQRLLAIMPELELPLHIFEIPTGREIRLPRPKTHRLPAGLMHWWRDTAVLFMPHEDASVVFDLDSLWVHSLDADPVWSAWTADERSSWSRSLSSSLPSNEQWRFSLHPKVERYEMPAKSEGNVQLTQNVHLSLTDERARYSRVFSQVPVPQRTRLLIAQDGSKVLRVLNGEFEVFYFGIRTPAKLSITVTMPSAPTQELTRKLQEGRLCAFVCAPLINPLNNKVIGADSGLVKGLARFRSWVEKTASVSVVEEYSEITESDVLADWHEWKAGRIIPASAPTKDLWTHIATMRKDEEAWDTSIPELEHEPSPIFEREYGVPTLQTLVQRSSSATSTESPPPQNPAALSAPSAPPPPATPDDDTLAALRTFIFNHHAMSSRSDISAMLSNFAERVVYMNHGTVGRDFIAKDLAAYHKAARRVTDTVISTPTVAVLREGEFQTAYLLSHQREMPDGRWTKGVAEISLRIGLTPAGLKILEEHIKPREQQKGP